MNKEKEFFKTCFNTLTGLEVKNESQAIAKEVVLSEIENLQEENKQLKDNWNKLKEIIKKNFVSQGGFTSYEWNDLLNELLDKMQEIEGGVSDDNN